MKDKQTEALKLALEALEAAKEELIAYHKAAEGEDYNSPALNNAITAIREALAEQSAQGCEFCSHPLYAGTKCKNCGRETAQQEPVAWMCSDESLTHKGYSRFSRACVDAWNIPVYTAPNRREWVGLTEDEVEQIADGCCPRIYWQAIEARLKEKNK